MSALQSSSLELAVLLAGVGVLVGVAADVADGDLGFLGQLLRAGHHLLAHVARQRRNVEPDDLAVAVGRQAQVAVDDAPLDVLDDRRIERPDDQLLRLGRADRAIVLIGVGEP